MTLWRKAGRKWCVHRDWVAKRKWAYLLRVRRIVRITWVCRCCNCNVNGRVHIWCNGGDLLDGTPVLDIKPYIPFVEAKPDAKAGFVSGAPELLNITWLPENLPVNLSTEHRQLIEQSLAQDPRPAYQNLPERIYGTTIAGFEVKFRIEDKHVVILSVVSLN